MGKSGQREGKIGGKRKPRLEETDGKNKQRWGKQRQAEKKIAQAG